MNVRFFGGYKSEYVSIQKHNPTGLYFCADTRELFLGDRLLSDGLRVVATFADLPSISDNLAAEGVIYFVEATKNGYVLPRGGSEWLQVIYAPTNGNGETVDLSNYYTSAEVDEAIIRAIENIEMEVDLSDYVTKEELAAVETKIPSIEGLATKQDIEEAISNIKHPVVDMTGYATEDYVDNKIAGINLPAVPTKVSELTNDVGYITIADVPEVDLSDYHTKDATEALINEAIANIDKPIAEIYKVDFNAPNYAEAVEAYEAGKVLVLVNAAPDPNSYALMNYVSEKYITFTKFLMSRSTTYGAFNTYYLRQDNTWELSKEVRLNQVEANVTGEATGALTSIRVGKDVYSLPDLDNYVTNELLEQNYITQEEIANTYVTEQHIVNNYVTQEAANNTYVTNEQITEVVTNEVNTVVTEQIENKVTEVIQEKVDAGEISVAADRISYGDF
jgi:hypothetical protein